MKLLAEKARLKYLYRKLVIGGKLKLPLEAARKLVGPDCAFHLYRSFSGGEKTKPLHPTEDDEK